MKQRLNGIALHMAAATVLSALAIVWSLPLAWHVSTHLPGAGLGDNTVFLWNFWWMRTALASGQDFFHTTSLFAPVGGDLTLHTHIALTAFIGATLLGGLPLLTALNLTTLAALSLNGFCAYLLAWRVTGDRGAATLAGIIFSCSPYFAAHLNGHFNLTTAWTIPLFALSAADAVRGSAKWAVLAGVILGVTAFIDYYYVVYEIAFAVCVLALETCDWSLTLGATGPWPRWASALIRSAIVADLLVILAIVLTGGMIVRLGAVQLSMLDTFNPRQLLWLLVGLALLMRYRPRFSARPRNARIVVGPARGLAVTLATFLLVAAPLVWRGIRLLAHGQYVTQQYHWRSAPVGIDVMTILLGNPFHGLWCSTVQRSYTSMGIDLIEGGAWLGVVPVLLSAYAMRRKSGDPTVRQWATIGAVFFVWALGSHLHAFGRNTGMLMPAAFLRYVPIVSNARIPGRAMVVVYLAAAVLSAIAAAEYRRRTRAPVLVLILTAALVFADFVAAPFPIVATECPAIYHTLRNRPERGALAELPLGLRDGLGALTLVDHRMLVCQAIHQRPLVGGVTARLPANVLPAYRADPLLAAWLRLSGAPPGDGVSNPALPAPDTAQQRLVADDIAFVMLNRRAASPQLRDYVERSLPLELIAQDEERSLYRVSR